MNLLAPIGKLYECVIDARNALYGGGTLRSFSLGARTISVGNLTTGGTGKTPIVRLVAEILAGKGEKVCILTRGYGRSSPNKRVLVSDGHDVLVDAAAGGDEPVELAASLLGKAVIIADRDRVGAADWARENFDVSVFVLDDGFQHRRVQRDVDIVCIDATNPFGNGLTLPAGSLRESIMGLNRANAVIVTRANLVDDTEEIVNAIRRINANIPIYLSRNELAKVVTLDDILYRKPGDAGSGGASVGWPILHPENGDPGVAAFCGLGNPDPFFTQVKNLAEKHNASVEWTKKFADHHRYSQGDINALAHRAQETSVSAFITTSKDAVKLTGLKFRVPCFVALSDVSVDPIEEFTELILDPNRTDT